MDKIIGKKIHITGIVQGVGFRPFIYSLASKLDIRGWVKNTSSGVVIHAEGPVNIIENFISEIQSDKPPLSKIDSLTADIVRTNGYREFTIVQSDPQEIGFQPVSPDVSICDQCLEELYDPGDRRYLYPFINCTNCGPRFTIIQDIPYDRPLTTMSEFEMCPDCFLEYSDPNNRRFHAQPIACPACGPRIWLESPQSPGLDKENKQSSPLETIKTAQNLLRRGNVLGVKGLGGFHLACDALNGAAVEKLRQRKHRIDKPFAVMFLNSEVVFEHCYMSDYEKRVLESPQRPIVILQRRSNSPLSTTVAPNQDTIGVMLPYTPLHYLLLAKLSESEASSDKNPSSASFILVMTSGNMSDEPIAISNQEAHDKLDKIVDAFLLHDRPILTRCDDSVIKVFEPSSQNPGSETAGYPAHLYPIRRSRGYAPAPFSLPAPAPPVLAVGAELKNTFCLSRDDYVFVSQHIGDLSNYETYTAFENGIEHFKHLFRLNPEYIAHDLHPDYMSTKYAIERAEQERVQCFGVQHHHAHIASCMIENNVPAGRKVIGVAFDGTGYGIDRAIWGGEFLIAEYETFQRAAHLEYVPLPGGDIAIRAPARTALAYLWHTDIPWTTDLNCVRAISDLEKQVILNQLINNINSPLTSSMGRLFDAVASLTGVRQRNNYEAQASIEFEALCDKHESSSYPINFTQGSSGSGGNDVLELDIREIILSVKLDLDRGIGTPIIAAKFHNTISNMVSEVCCLLRENHTCNTVVLSGGVWQNFTLLNKTIPKLEKNGFSVLIHSNVPANDGGVSLGQLAVAITTMTNQ